MIDLSLIKNEKLRSLIQASAKFNALDESQQWDHLSNMQNLSPEKEEKICQFLAEENAKEAAPMSEEEQSRILNNFYNQISELKDNFAKLLKKDPELKQSEIEATQMTNLISTINK
jgi:hypothetical protein